MLNKRLSFFIKIVFFLCFFLRVWAIDLNDVTVLMETGFHLTHPTDFTGRLQRSIKADIFKFDDLAIGFEFNDEIYLGGPDRSSRSLHSIRHDLKYIYFRYDQEYRSYSLFYDHTCINPFGQERQERGWDVLGISIKSRNMRTAHVDSFIDFNTDIDWEYLSQFGYNLSLSRVLSSRRQEFRGQGQLDIRWDILRHKNYVPYLQVGTSITRGPGWSVDRNLEAGYRYHLSSLSLIPFFRYGYLNDIDVWQGERGSYFMGGLRLQTLAASNNFPKTDRSYSVLNNMHFEGFYAMIRRSDDFQYEGTVRVETELYRREQKRAILAVQTENLSPTAEFRPRYTLYIVEPRWGVEQNGKLYEVFFRHFSRYDVNVPKEFTVHAGLIGVSIGTEETRTGYKNSGIDFDTRVGWKFMNDLNWKFAAGPYIYEQNNEYYATTEGVIRWDFLRYNRFIQYLETSTNLFLRSGVDREHYFEAGTRYVMKGGLNVSAFTRYQYKNHAIRLGNHSQRAYMMAGVKLEY